MRVTALGAYMMKGTSKKTGSAYDMAKLIIRVPVESVATANMQRAGYGYTVNELDLDPQSLSKFAMNFPPEGIELDLVVGSEIRFGRLQSIITGCTRAQPLQKAA